MPVAVSWWLLGLIGAILGPILLRAYVRRVEDRARERTRRILAQANADDADRNGAHDVDSGS